MTEKNYEDYNFSENETKYRLYDSSRFTEEERIFENELKEFLFTLSNKLNYIGRPIDQLRKTYDELYNKLILLANKHHDVNTGEFKLEYYMLTRKFFPILKSFEIILSYYEKDFHSRGDKR